MSHTPTPWHLRRDDMGCLSVESDRHFNSGLAPTPKYGIARVWWTREGGNYQSEGEANAARIVLCVNAHEGLVDALKLIGCAVPENFYPDDRDCKFRVSRTERTVDFTNQDAAKVMMLSGRDSPTSAPAPFPVAIHQASRDIGLQNDALLGSSEPYCTPTVGVHMGHIPSDFRQRLIVTAKRLFNGSATLAQGISRPTAGQATGPLPAGVALSPF